MMDGIIKGDGTSRFIKATLPETYEEFKAACASGSQMLDILMNLAGWDTIPDFLNKANLLKDSTAALFNLSGDTALPDKVFEILGRFNNGLGNEYLWEKTNLDVTVSYGYVNSPNSDAYPPLEPDGYSYTPIGKLGGKVQIVAGTYSGTGKYGKSNPNSLTFDVPPKLIFLTMEKVTSNPGFSGPIQAINNPMDCSVLTTDYVERLGFYSSSQRDGYLKSFAKKSEDGKTVYWYNTENANYQINFQNYTYYFVAIL